jgi:hypothetical protein
MKQDLTAVNTRFTELAAEKEAWDVERRSMEDMCARLLSEVERLRNELGSSSGSGIDGMTMRMDRIERPPERLALKSAFLP